MRNDEWQQITLGEFVMLQRGHDLPTSTRSRGKIPILGSFGITGWHNKSKAKGPGVTVGRSGGSMGVVSFSPVDYWPLNTALYVNDFHGNSPKFAYYFLKSIDFARYNSGSAQPSLNRNYIHPIKISVPFVPEQKAIAHVIGSLDDRIALNRRMNETLEAMAQDLFKSWFVDFDPVLDNAIIAGKKIPGALRAKAEVRMLNAEVKKNSSLSNHNASFHSLFPDEFTHSDESGWIPKGWGCGSILEKAKLLSGGTPKTSISEYWGGDIPWASAKDVSQCGESFLIHSARHITPTGLAKSSTKIIPKFSTVFVARGATTGRLTMFGEDMAMNQTCYGLRADSEMHFYTYCHAKHFIDSIVNAGHGSIFTTITTTTFEASKVIHADEMIISNFEEFVSPIFYKILSNQIKTKSLTQLRDTLLPKLLSGELRIPDAERMVEELAL